MYFILKKTKKFRYIPENMYLYFREILMIQKIFCEKFKCVTEGEINI